MLITFAGLPCTKFLIQLGEHLANIPIGKMYAKHKTATSDRSMYLDAG